MPWSAPVHCPAGHPPFKGRGCPLCKKKTHAEVDRKRPNSNARGYDNKWVQASKGYLKSHPTCVDCNQPATLVDHIVPHKGDMKIFWQKNNWQPMCASCHGRKTVEHDGGFGKQRAIENAERSRPSGLRRSRIPLVIVCGPSGGGKSTYVAENAGPDDLIIDLDDIKSELSGMPIYCSDAEWVSPALEKRNDMLRSLADRPAYPRAWFIVSAPGKEERDWWKRCLKPQHIEIVAPPLETVLKRLGRDYRRAGRADHFKALARSWYDCERRGVCLIKIEQPQTDMPMEQSFQPKMGFFQ